MKVWICQWNIPCNIKPRFWLNLGTRCPSVLPLPVWSPGWLTSFHTGKGTLSVEFLRYWCPLRNILMLVRAHIDMHINYNALFDAGLTLRFPLWSSSEHFCNSRQWYRWLTQSSLVISFSRYFNYIYLAWIFTFISIILRLKTTFTILISQGVVSNIFSFNCIAPSGNLQQKRKITHFCMFFLVFLP